MIATAAAAALALGHPPAPAHPDGHAVRVHRLRVGMCRDVAVMLDVPAAYVVATDDPDRAYGPRPGHLLTVHDPDDPTTVYRFVPEAGLGGIYLLLDECPACDVPRVPMATVSGLAELGGYLAATRPPHLRWTIPTSTGAARSRPRSSSATPPTARTAGSAIRSGNHTRGRPDMAGPHGGPAVRARARWHRPGLLRRRRGRCPRRGSRTLLVLPVWLPQVQGPAT